MRLPAGEHLHDAAAAQELAIGALLSFIGPAASRCARREVELRECVGLSLLEHLGRLGAEALNLLSDKPVQLVPCILKAVLAERDL